MHNLEPIINSAFEQIATLSPQTADPAYKDAVAQIMQALGEGSIRVAEKHGQAWVINQWVKKAILVHFRLQENQVINAGAFNYYDKVGLKYSAYTAADFQQQGARIVPPAVVREGVYIAPNAVLMAAYINIGAYIGSGTMIDIWTTVGSCAQLGKNCHISSNTCIGGVIEPLQANPVIIEDNCFVGAGVSIVEGIIVEENSVISMGVRLGQSTKIYDRTKDEVFTGRVPAGSVVVPGSMPSKDGKYNIDCAIIVKTVDSQTRAKVGVNQILREVADV